MVFLLSRFHLVFLPTTLTSLLLGVTLLNPSTTLRDSANNIEKTSQKGALERERFNRSVLKRVHFDRQFIFYKLLIMPWHPAEVISCHQSQMPWQIIAESAVFARQCGPWIARLMRHFLDDWDFFTSFTFARLVPLDYHLFAATHEHFTSQCFPDTEAVKNTAFNYFRIRTWNTVISDYKNWLNFT